jgi:hypothetical protein
VIATNNRFSGPPGLTIAEQTRGNILLKNWEQDITLSKEQAQKVANSLEEAVNNINGEQLGIEIGADTEALRQINIDRISLDIKEENPCVHDCLYWLGVYVYTTLITRTTCINLDISKREMENGNTKAQVKLEKDSNYYKLSI